MHTAYQPLQKAPLTVTPYKEIITVYNHHIVEYFNALTPQERVVIYYLFRASLPGNLIAADQSHRDARAIRALFEHITRHKDAIKTQKLSFDTEQFLKEVEIYSIYLWTNHSHYFAREHADEKRTPERLGLQLLTKDNLIAALLKTNYPNAQEVVTQLVPSLFDRSIEPTLCVPNSIDTSAVNFYAANFTDKDFEQTDKEGQHAINAYFYIDAQGKPKYQKYSVEGKYESELRVAVYWLQQACKHAHKYPQQFDDHFIQSLAYLIEYLKSGDEELFKKHSIEWLKTASKIDYVYGFIETYDDPKGYRAIFQSDVTIKSIDIDRLNKILPDVEDRLPFDALFKRPTLKGSQRVMPNASINVKAFSAGSLGPLNITLAYCLPNYEEIRAQHGSKQIMYHAEKSMGELINAQLYHRLFNRSDYYAWFQKHDPEYQLMETIYLLEVILHETLGHGSGQLWQHTFIEGDQLTIGGTTYKVGETIPVTSDNLPQLLAGYEQTLEELRAEIIALLASILFYDDFARLGMLKEWPTKIGKEKIIEFSIISMMRTALHRLISQPDNATEVAGAHAQANMTIMNYLIERGVITIEQEPITIAQGNYTVLDIRIINLERSIAVITELANLVQQIKSTGDGVKVRWLVDTYGKPICREHMEIIKRNRKAVVGDIKVAAMIYPRYEPVTNSAGEVIDITATWPDNLEQQFLAFEDRALKTE